MREAHAFDPGKNRPDAAAVSVVCKWNAPWPQPQRHEVLLQMPAYACLQDWDMLTHFLEAAFTPLDRPERRARHAASATSAGRIRPESRRAGERGDTFRRGRELLGELEVLARPAANYDMLLNRG